MYLDNRDRAVVTVTDHVLVFEQKGPPGHLRFKKVEDYDLSAWVGANDNIQTVMPDWQGRSGSSSAIPGWSACSTRTRALSAPEAL